MKIGAPDDDADARAALHGKRIERAANAARRRATSTTWHVPARLARLLELLPCGQAAASARSAALEAAAAIDPAALVVLGADERTPLHVRRSALALVGRLSPSPDVLDALADIAISRDNARLARAGAIEGLAAAGEALRVASLASDADPVVAALGRRASR